MKFKQTHETEYNPIVKCLWSHLFEAAWDVNLRGAVLWEDFWLPLEEQRAKQMEKWLRLIVLLIHLLRAVSDERPRVGSGGFSGGSNLGQGQGHWGQRWDEVQHHRWRWKGHLWHHHWPYQPFWCHHSEKGKLVNTTFIYYFLYN